MSTSSFDVDTFVGECQVAIAEDRPHAAVREVLERRLGDRGARDVVARALPPEDAGIVPLHVADDLTVLRVVWGPGMRLYPHDHRMWAAIGIYAGQEDNTFYRRSGPERRDLTESGGKELATGDVLVLGDDTIHAVANPLRRLTGAIHAYGGDFVNQPRSQWGPGPLEERPYDMAVLNRQFADANSAWQENATR